MLFSNNLELKNNFVLLNNNGNLKEKGKFINL